LPNAKHKAERGITVVRRKRIKRKTKRISFKLSAWRKKKGSAAARNKGILKANANIIVFTDSDCIVDREWLRHIVSPLNDERIGIVGGKILAKRPCNELEKFGEKIHDHENIIKKLKPPYVITMNWASRQAVLKELGLFDEKFIRGQDVDLSFRILKKGYELVYEPKAIVYHRNENTLLGLFLEGYAHGFNSLRIIKKHKDFMKQFGYRRFNPKSYYELLSYLIARQGYVPKLHLRNRPD